MKKLLGIVVLGLLVSGNAYSNNLMGKKLECENHSPYTLGPDYYNFVSERRVNRLTISKGTLKVSERVNNFRAYPKTIDIYIGESYAIKSITIYRETLKTSEGTKCKIITLNIRDHLKKISNQLLKEQSDKNKI